MTVEHPNEYGRHKGHDVRRDLRDDVIEYSCSCGETWTYRRCSAIARGTGERCQVGVPGATQATCWNHRS